ncbi:hypothetical protein GW916_10255 [bacterium]|nr:hypothetical protein [bacterium]
MPNRAHKLSRTVVTGLLFILPATGLIARERRLPLRTHFNKVPLNITVVNTTEDHMNLLVTYRGHFKSRLKRQREIFVEKVTARIRPYKSDSCTLFPAGSWGHCCEAHDLEYWLGGTKQNRKNADLSFKQCVAESGGSILAAIMYLGVRMGGSAKFQTPWTWGFGWNYNRRYLPFSEEELVFAQKNLDPFHRDIPDRTPAN